MKYADEPVFTFARVMVQIKTVCVDQVMWCLQQSNNHQGLLWNVQCVSTVVLRMKQEKFKSAVKICDLSCSFSAIKYA